LAEGCAAVVLLLLIGRWGEAGDPLEQSDEGRDAIETHAFASFGYGDIGLQELFCIFDADAGQVLVWRFAIRGFE